MQLDEGKKGRGEEEETRRNEQLPIGSVLLILHWNYNRVSYFDRRCVKQDCRFSVQACFALVDGGVRAGLTGDFFVVFLTERRRRLCNVDAVDACEYANAPFLIFNEFNFIAIPSQRCMTMLVILFIVY